MTGSNGQSQILGGLASISRVDSPAVVTHYNIQPTLDLYANVQGRDLGGVARDIQKSSTTAKRCGPRARPSACTGRSTPCMKPSAA